MRSDTEIARADWDTMVQSTRNSTHPRISSEEAESRVKAANPELHRAAFPWLYSGAVSQDSAPSNAVYKTQEGTPTMKSESVGQAAIKRWREKVKARCEAIKQDAKSKGRFIGHQQAWSRAIKDVERENPGMRERAVRYTNEERRMGA